MSDSTSRLIEQIEHTVRRDPARRGLLGHDGGGPGRGDLLSAARHLADHGRKVAILTGFFIPSDPAPNDGAAIHSAAGHPETDGPPGAALLACVLSALGIPSCVITDELCAGVVRTAVDTTHDVLSSETAMQRVSVHAAPLQSTDWQREFVRSDTGRDITHAIAIERVGPSHTSESLVASLRRSRQETDDRLHPEDQLTLDRFHAEVPGDTHNRCFNMRGRSIDEFTGDLHTWFEASRQHGITTIGVGDGGNELGMGRFSWRDLRDRISGPAAAWIPCRIAADATIVSGTSNWGAFALAAAVTLLKGRIASLAPLTADRHHDLLSSLVSAGAVDGVTRRAEPTVDGLPFLTYIEPWLEIGRLLG